MTTKDNLTRDDAFFRSSFVKSCHYQIKLGFQRQIHSYNGLCTINFQLSGIPEKLELDFIFKEIQDCSLNGQKLKLPTTRDNGIELCGQLLKNGENELTVKYCNEFDNNGQGLHKFTDPEDNKEYIYSDSEPFEAHRIFPCFDQPDIKASYSLTVTTPEEWEISANSSPQHVETAADTKTVVFARTPVFSTYLFCIVAGDYFAVTDKDSDFAIPMRILCRQSLKKYLRPEFMFQVTKQSMKFYENFFKIPFPFDKYDHAFVPEFINGAMENTGLITFIEHYLFRDEPTKEMMADFANTIAHELAHMWFGNMVTMKWWGDLWLNESFATFLAYYALENSEPGFPNTMLKFCKEVKHYALFEDQLSTTHPIILDCPDTDTAFENFDGITYQKGAAVLFQLLKLMGEENFRLAIHQYLKDGAWKNSEPEDLIKNFSPYCNFDFRQWFQLWFATEGVNNVKAEVIAEKGIIKNIKLLQGSDSGQTLRPHTACIALIYDRGDENVKIKSADIFYEGECTENTDFCQQKEPDFIFCNYRDYDYVNCVLSESSLNWLKKGRLCHIEEELLRMQIWNSLIDMVNNKHLSPLSFCELSLVYADKEKNDDIFTHFMRYALEFIASFYPDKKRKQDSAALFERAKKELENNGTKLSVDRQKLWFMYLIFTAVREEDFDLLCQFTDREHFFGIKLDIEMRWQIIKLLALHRHKRFPKLLEDMQKRDESHSGLNKRDSAKALFTKDKKSLFNDIFENNELSVNRKSALMRAVFHREQLAESTELIDPYFTKLAEVCRGDDKIFRQYCINYMFPFYHTKIALQRSNELISGDFPESLKKLLLVKIEMMQRRVMIMEKYFGEKA